MKNIEKRVGDLVFYGTGDESYELFRATCSLLYQMNGLGETDKAEILFTWANEQAIFSRQWALETYGSLDEIDFEHGIYSY